MRTSQILGTRAFAMAITSLLLVGCISIILFTDNASANTASGYIYPDEYVIYYIDVDTYTSINITVSWTSSSNDIDLFLYDPSSALISSSEQAGTTNENISHYPSTTGTHALYIYGYSIATSEYYTLTSNFLATLYTGGSTPATASADTYEPDDLWTSATALSPGITQTHSIHNNGQDVDWFSFTTYEPNDVTIATSGLSGDTEIALYDSVGVPTSYLASDDDGGSGSFSSITSYDLPAGTYYIELIEHGMDADIASYNIDLTISPSLGSNLGGLLSFDDYLCMFIFLIFFIVLIAGISSARKKRKKKKLERQRQKQYQAQQAQQQQYRGRQQTQYQQPRQSQQRYQQPQQRPPQQPQQQYPVPQQQPQYQPQFQQQPTVPVMTPTQGPGQKREDDRRAKEERERQEKMEAEKQARLHRERKEQILRENRERQEATRRAREERERQERMDAEKRESDRRHYQEIRESRARQVEDVSDGVEGDSINLVGMLHTRDGSDVPPPPPTPEPIQAPTIVPGGHGQAPAPLPPPPPPDPELLKILDEACDLVIPTYLDPGATSEIIIDIKNNTSMDLESIEVNFSDMQKYFEIQDTLVFPGVRRGMTLREDVKFKPKYNEGTFPVIIEIISGGARLKEEYTIKVGGTEIY